MIARAKREELSKQGYPFEQWRYRYIDGVGQDVIIEFVDSSGQGEYKMTVDPTAKDALQHPARGAVGR